MTLPSKERVLYFLMGMAAVMFVSADVIAQFDADPNTRTATNWVKETWWGRLLGCLLGLWVILHFAWDGFPL